MSEPGEATTETLQENGTLPAAHHEKFSLAVLWHAWMSAVQFLTRIPMPAVRFDSRGEANDLQQAAIFFPRSER